MRRHRAGNLVFTPAANANGDGYASFTFQVQDNGGTANGGVDIDQSANTITINVTPVNDAPTIDVVTDVTVNEDAPQQTVSPSGIGTGAANESQTLTITAMSDNTGLVPHPTIVYTSPGATGTLKFTPVANEHGTAVITVTVTDDGGTATVEMTRRSACSPSPSSRSTTRQRSMDPPIRRC